jgi:DNA-nicking Smr family endonuclease
VKRRGLAGLQVLQELLAERRREAERQQRLEQQRATQRLAAEATQRREANLFARSVGPVTPLRTALRADVRRAKPAPLPRQRERDEREVLRESLTDEMDTESLIETDDALSWHRHWVGPDVLRKLRRGVWVVQGQVDLHGLRRDEAREALALFLAGALRRGWRCVRVVHGKGHGSPGRQPVLKDKVRHWLAQRRAVLAFTQARGPDGGAGALIVLLDPPRKQAGQ